MKNQFIYKEEISIPGIVENVEKGITGIEPYVQTKTNSFNINLVSRTVTLDNGNLLVLLNDMHEREEEVPSMNNNGKRILRRQKVMYQSEITLSKEDKERFFNLTSFENV